MSERMTSVSLNRGDCGWMDYGRRTHAEMVAQYRAVAEREAEVANERLAMVRAAKDEEFVVETFLGPWAMGNRERIEPEATS